jgi:iron-sulfur cluster assembly protein
MLTLTETAAEALDAIAASASMPDTAGLRIARNARADGAGDLSLTLVEEAEPDDQVVKGASVPVFVDAEAATFLEDKVLDAQIQDGQVGFQLGVQGP